MLSLLEDEDKIRSSPFTASYLRSKTWHAASSATTRSIADYFWTDHTIQIVRNPNLIREAIVNGVKNENWVYYDAGTGKTYTSSTMAGFSPEMKPDAEVMTASEAQSRGLLVRKPTQTDLRAVVTNDDLTGAEIRSRLEAQCGGEPTKTDVLELLATAVQASDYKWFVVLDAEPAPGVRALSPSAIKDKGLDGLRILSREVADAQEIEVPTRTPNSKTFNASGPGGAAMQSLLDQISDFTVPTVSTMTLKVTADEASGTSDIDLAVASLGMLQKQHITVRATIRAEFKGVNGGVQFQGTADRQDFQSAYNHVKKAISGAVKVAGEVTLVFRFTPALDITDAQFGQIHTVIKNLGMKSTTMTAEVTK